MNGKGTYGALRAAQKEGRRDLDGQPLDLRGQLAIMEAVAHGVQDPARLRQIARRAKS